jgi:DNA-binding NarL/FixJ family response regulator
MSAIKPAKRKHTARVLGEKMGLSARQVRRYIAEPRENFERRAATRRAQVAAMRKQGLPLADIAKELNTTVNAVKSLHKQARKEASQ